MILEEYFDGHEESRQLFDCLRDMVASLGDAELLVQKSGVAFRRKRAFAYAWMPGKYLRGRVVAPLVLTIPLRRRDASPRWKEIVEAAPGRFTHHLELYSSSDVDKQVWEWLQEAWIQAG